MHGNKIQKVCVQTQEDLFLDTWPSATAFRFPHLKHTALTGVTARVEGTAERWGLSPS